MEHLKSSNLSPEEIPEGFTAGNGPAQEQQSESQKRELQRRAILEQALTPEAWQRLGTIRVSVCSPLLLFSVILKVFHSLVFF